MPLVRTAQPSQLLEDEAELIGYEQLHGLLTPYPANAKCISRTRCFAPHIFTYVTELTFSYMHK